MTINKNFIPANNEYCCTNGANNAECIVPGTPVVSAPVYKAPTYTAPAVSAPVYTAPTYTAPVQTLSDEAYGSDVAYTPETDYLPPSEDSLREYLPPALRRRKLRVQKRRLRYAKRQ